MSVIQAKWMSSADKVNYEQRKVFKHIQHRIMFQMKVVDVNKIYNLCRFVC
jgi:hypothetical protein